MPAADITVASYNIHKGVGTDRRRDLRRTAAVIAELDADLVALQEADRRFGDRAGLLDLEHLKDETGLVPVKVEGAAARTAGTAICFWSGTPRSRRCRRSSCRASSRAAR